MSSLKIPITKDNIDKVLEFLPYFEEKKNKFFIQVEDSGFPDYAYSKEVNNFLSTLYKENFTVHYPEYKRRKDIYSLIDRSIPLSEADTGDIGSIFKIIMAGERIQMGGGYLADCIENGLVLDLLRRLKEIRDYNYPLF